MEQKDNIEKAVENLNPEPIVNQEEIETVNPVEDAFNALAEALNLETAAQDGTALFGALLSMPEDQFEIVAPHVLDNMQRSMNDPNSRIALVASLSNTGYKGDELTSMFIDICNEIDAQMTDISQQKRDWIKQMMGIVVNAISETEGISKRYIRIPYEKSHDDAKQPAYAHETDSGMDVYALEDITLAPGEQKIVPIGIKVALPAGYELQVRPKSGLSSKTKLRIANAPGTIDAGYRDEIGIIIENTEPPIKSIATDFAQSPNDYIPIGAIEFGASYTIGKGQKFAQLVLAEVPKAVLYEVETVSNIGEDRNGGFGSTGQY